MAELMFEPSDAEWIWAIANNGVVATIVALGLGASTLTNLLKRATRWRGKAYEVPTWSAWNGDRPTDRIAFDMAEAAAKRQRQTRLVMWAVTGVNLVAFVAGVVIWVCLYEATNGITKLEDLRGTFGTTKALWTTRFMAAVTICLTCQAILWLGTGGLPLTEREGSST